jgi:hypothetical protein
MTMRTVILATLIVPLSVSAALAQGHGLEAVNPCGSAQACNNSSPGTIGNGYHVQAPQGTPIWDGGAASNAVGVAAGVAGVYGAATGNPAAIGAAAGLGAAAAVGGAMGDMGIGPSDTANAASDAGATEGVGGTGVGNGD